MTHSFDPGEQLRITPGAGRALVIRHGANEIATIKRAFGGGVRIRAGEREWRLAPDDRGWTAAGDPAASLRSRWLRGAELTIGGDHTLTVSRRRVRGPGTDLRFDLDKSGAKPVLRGEIAALPQDGDATAVVVLATTAVVLGADLSMSSTANLNGDNTSAAVRYAPGI